MSLPVCRRVPCCLAWKIALSRHCGRLRKVHRRPMPSLRVLLMVLAFATGSLLPGQAHAQVTCSVTPSNLAFPTTMDVLPGAAFDSASSVATSCTGLTGSNRVLLCYALNAGTYPTSGAWRQMGSAANRLLFQAYTDAARSVLWGTTGTGLIRVSLTAAAPAATTPYYGRVSGSQQTAVPAAYSTTMTMTVTGLLYTGTTAPACPTASLGTRTFTVTGTVVSSCNATATNLVFPNTSVIAANVDGSSTVSVTCTNTTPYHVRLNGGLSGATSPSARKMTLGAAQITYGLYRDIGRSQGWGSTDGVDTSPGTGTASAIGHTVYGRIPPQTTPAPGTYTDTIVVTVSFL